MNEVLLGNHIDFDQLQAQYMVIHKLPAPPANPVTGQVYFDTTQQLFGVYTSGGWAYMSTNAIVNAVTMAVMAAAANQLIVSDGNRSVKTYSTNGLVKVANSVIAQAVADSDYVTPSGGGVISNKTFSGLNNTFTNLALSVFNAGVIDTDPNLTANSDTRLATQKAVRSYIDTIAVTGGREYISGLDASTNPQYPAASKGHTYIISVAGRIGGASGPTVNVGDTIIAKADTAAGTHADVGGNWDIIVDTIGAATTTSQGTVELATQIETEFKSSNSVVVTPATLVNFAQKRTFTYGNAAATSFVLNHNLNTLNVTVALRTSTGDNVLTKWVATDANNITVTHSVAPALNGMLAVITG